MTNKYFKKLFIVVALFTSFFMFSAFTQKKGTGGNFITRLEFAAMVNEVLAKEFNRSIINENNSYSDLTFKENESILLATKLGIMSGYPDGTFRPNEKIRNIETITYLQMLANLFVASDHNSYASKQLMRLFAYNENIKPGDPVPEGVFPKKLLNAGELSDRESVCSVFEVLNRDSNYKKFKEIKGIVIDSVSGKHVRNAFASINGIAIAAGEDGEFCLSVPVEDNRLDLFAAAEGYEVIDIKKDITFENSLILKMRPSYKQ